MRILLSNDDGILAPGLVALHAAVRDLGEVDVAAPASAQSAAGHAITLTQPLTVQRVTVDGPDGFVGLSIDGRPADCVRLAIRNLLAQPPELVLSGVNAGNNVGINVFYSGTVAAAAEGAMFGIPAVSFSCATAGETDFPRVSQLCRDVLETLLSAGLRPGELVNVNLPPLGPGVPKGVKVVRQSTAGLIDDYFPQAPDGQGRRVFQIGEDFSFLAEDEDSDVVRLAEGYVTVTPLHIDRTDYRRLDTLGELHWDIA